MYSILFVDDEVNILRAMRRQFYPFRDRWKVMFAESAEKALEILDEAEIDVVISDVAMPHVNGLDFLRKVSVKHPKVTRVILSGQVDEDMTLDCVKIAHRVFAKPIQISELIERLKHLISLDSFIENEAYTERLLSINTIPPIPSTIVEINKKLNEPESSINDIGAIIASDPAISASVLKLVNSPFFSLKNDIFNPVTAVSLLGIETIKAFIINNYLDDYFKQADYCRFDKDKLKEHSFIVSKLTVYICNKLGLNAFQKELAFSAAVMHDVGKLILLYNFKELYCSVIDEAIKYNTPIWEIESASLGISHTEVGAYIFSLWGLPPDLINAILFHHRPSLSPYEELSPLLALHIADVMEHNYIKYDESHPSRDLDFDFIERFGINDKLESISKGCESICKEVMLYE